ncbi:uncharacterized protein LOC128219007 isoform X2 [Mya arenaria]|uniref:uncharacterized protein LOC128219007 isoform X2 n=1 Tax=Mya arenaria TaxID=6604 RepID=UPI0022E63944|nr:uncharacterized protein LOC128219007 isoform X2 [Mya arenaria]
MMRYQLKVPSSYRSLLRGCLMIIIIIFVIESLIINTVLLYYIWSAIAILSDFSTSGRTLIDTLATYKTFQNIVFSGKDQGFRKFIDNTIGRLYIENDITAYCMSDELYKEKRIEHLPVTISRIGFDVSSSGEVMAILRQMQSQKSKPWARLVVDIGANDGLMSSNSFNFIQMGWSAILVEPQNSQLDLARRNHIGLTNQHQDQRVQYVQAVISDHDGQERLYLSPDIVAMESRVVSNELLNDHSIITVTSLSVKTFALKYKVPKYFGILSIDTEGMDAKILHQWIQLGYRPIYIVVEYLHQKEQDMTTSLLMEEGYSYLMKKGYNFIFQYNIDLMQGDET